MDNISFSRKSDLKWKGLKKYQDKGYTFPTCYIQESDGNLCFKAVRWNRENYYITIPDYKRYSALDIVNILIKYSWDSRHIIQALYDFYQENDLELGFIKPYLRSVPNCVHKM